MRTSDGKVWGIPTGLLSLTRLYNRDLITTAGVTVPTDWSKGWDWNETERIAKLLTKGEGANKSFGLSFQTYDAHWGVHVMWQNSAEYYSTDLSQALIDRPEAVEAVEWVRKLALDDKVVPTSADLGTGGAHDMFLAGRLAMWETHQNDIIGIKQAKFPWDVMPLSIGKMGKPISIQATDHWAMLANGSNKDGAWALLNYLTGEDAETYFAENAVFGVPARRAVAERVKDRVFGGSNPTVHFDSLDVMREATYATNQAEVRKTIHDNLDPIMLGQATAQQACTATAAALLPLLQAQ
jgi:ABC-type glycerol-3-phosphate transport system substrate-binding protein